MTDYYSEDILPCDDEEIYESFPSITKTEVINTVQSEEPIEEFENAELIIEEPDINKMKQLNEEFESKLKLELLNGNLRLGGNIQTNDKDTIHKNRVLRFTLLEKELRSLMKELKNDQNDLEKPLLEKVDSLINEIDIFNSSNLQNKYIDYWDKKLSEVKLNNAEKEHETEREHDKADISHSDDILQSNLEHRISQLESRTGYQNPDDSRNFKAIIDDLYKRVNILLDNGGNLKTIDEEVTNLIENCELFIQNSKKIKNINEIVPLNDKKLNFLYDKVKKLPEYENLLNNLTLRFNSLQDVIRNAQNTVTFMNGLDQEFKNIESKLDKWDEKINKLESDLIIDERNFQLLLERSTSK